ncbi:MAG: hypothetical protein BZY80_00500 [SAR202 cluster bacterium Io17-Chloro-G2]|nr:MAG: hypothetical protein BZY80_00500 [SAR202 cluster bacterium Io17-Chloro-G2]
MYSLIRVLPWRRLLSEQAPAFGSSLLVAELFYKFHSFLLETGAFLATWFVVDLVISTVKERLRRRRSAEANLSP